MLYQDREGTEGSSIFAALRLTLPTLLLTHAPLTCMWRVFITVSKRYILCIVCLSGQSEMEAQVPFRGQRPRLVLCEAVLLKKILSGSVVVLAALPHRVSSRTPSGNVGGTKGTERD